MAFPYILSFAAIKLNRRGNLELFCCVSFSEKINMCQIFQFHKFLYDVSLITLQLFLSC